MDGTGKQPPIGIPSKRQHDLIRMNDIVLAMLRYSLADIPIPKEWVLELDNLIDENHLTAAEAMRRQVA